MVAYIIATIDVHDSAAYDTYRAKVPETLAKYGGKFVVRGGPHETLEGDWHPKRVVVLEFPSMDAAKRWYNSPEYRPLIAIRKGASSGALVAVEGV